MVQSLAGLAHDVLQVPDGKTFFAGQHGSDAVALHILHGGATLGIDLFDADKLRDVVTAERRSSGGFLQYVLHQRIGLFGQHVQLDGLQGDRLPALRIGGLIDRANLGVRNFAEYLETSDLIGHCSLSPGTSMKRQSSGKTPEVTLGGKVPLEYRGSIQDGSYEGTRKIQRFW